MGTGVGGVYGGVYVEVGGPGTHLLPNTKGLYVKSFKSLRTPAPTAKSLQSCPTLCNRIDGSPPGSPIPGILQARTLEWVAISFSG